MKSMKKETLATYGLVIVAVFWGLGFPALKVVSYSIPTFYLISMRFLIATALLAVVFHKKLKHLDKTLIKLGFVLSIFLFLCYVSATLGIKYTSSAKASFFTCLGVLVIPIILRIIYKEKISKQVVISITICTIGLFLMSYSKGMGVNLTFGDIICLTASVTGAAHVVIISRYASDMDAVLLAIVQLFFISIWGFCVGFFFEDVPDSIPIFHIGVLIFLAIFCTAMAFVLQTACQKYINPSRVGMIFSIEPVTGALFSTLLLGDQLGINGLLGGSLIFASLIYMEKAKKPELQELDPE